MSGCFARQYLCGCHAAASIHKLTVYSPGDATLFDFVVIYNGSKLFTEGGGQSRISTIVLYCNLQFVSIL